MVAEDIIIRPIITEKSRAEMNREVVCIVDGVKQIRKITKYTFEVNKKATKIDIRNAVEKLFEVKVCDVKTVTVRGKERRQGVHVGKTSDWKKAIVTIEGEAKTLKYTEKGGKEKSVVKNYKTTIEEFGI